MDLRNYLPLNQLIQCRDTIKKVFFFRICGTGMGAAAILLREKGLHVEGMDVKFYPPMSDYLAASGIKTFTEHEVGPEDLQRFDLIVVGNVVGGKSAAARMIENLGIPFTSFPAALGALVLHGANIVGIAGTHGKTTTTYLMAQIFQRLGTNPGFLIGGVMDELPSARLGDGKYFFIEADEYDSAYFEKYSKFRSYCLRSLVLTSLEFDHADIFANVEQIQAEFFAIWGQITDAFILNTDYEGVCQLELAGQGQRQNGAQIYHYGLRKEQCPQIVTTRPDGTVFSMSLAGQQWEFTTNLVGEHNILNLASVLLYAHQQGFSPAQLQTTTTALKMVKRRQEYRGRYQQALFIDDFAHHPRAVAVTIDAMKVKYPQLPLVALFAPASASARSDIFEEDFAKALERANQWILVRPQLPTTVQSAANISCERIGQHLEKFGKVFIVDDYPSLLQAINEVAQQEVVILVMNNGSCLDLWEKLPLVCGP